MNTHSHDFVTVDMRGLKAALVARAQSQRVSVSVLVRGALIRELGVTESPETHRLVDAPVAASASATVKLSIRFTQAEAAQLAAGASAAGLSRGAYLAGLINLFSSVDWFQYGANVDLARVCERHEGAPDG